MRRVVPGACAILSVGLATGATAQLPQPQVFAPGIISSGANDLAPAFTPDGNTVFFTRANASESVILVSHRADGQWSEPTIAPFSGTWLDLEPAMAPDGTYLIFSSNRPSTPQGRRLDGFYNGKLQPGRGGNLWRVDRTPDGWGEPRRLPDVVNGNTSVFSPSIAADGSLYFMQPDGPSGQFHLYRAQAANGAYEAPTAVPLSTAPDTGDFDPAVAPDESFMVFSSQRGGRGTSLYIAFRRGKDWTTPAFLGDQVSQAGAGNIEARLSPDASTLYFSSSRLEPPPEHPDREATSQALRRMVAWNNGLLNVWSVPLEYWLEHAGSRESRP